MFHWENKKNTLNNPWLTTIHHSISTPPAGARWWSPWPLPRAPWSPRASYWRCSSPRLAVNVAAERTKDTKKGGVFTIQIFGWRPIKNGGILQKYWVCYHQTTPKNWVQPPIFRVLPSKKLGGRTIESWNLTTKPLKISGCDTQKQRISQQVVKSPMLNGTGWWFQPIHFQCARHPKYRSFLV